MLLTHWSHVRGATVRSHGHANGRSPPGTVLAAHSYAMLAGATRLTFLRRAHGQQPPPAALGGIGDPGGDDGCLSSAKGVRCLPWSTSRALEMRANRAALPESTSRCTRSSTRMDRLAVRGAFGDLGAGTSAHRLLCRESGVRSSIVSHSDVFSSVVANHAVGSRCFARGEITTSPPFTSVPSTCTLGSSDGDRKATFTGFRFC